MRPLLARLKAVEDSPKGMPREWGLLTVAGAKATVRRKTGTTARTIRMTKATRTEAVVAVGGAGVYLEHGTRPHIIRPKRGRFLKFPAKGTAVTLSGRARKGGRFAFARVVHHPGTKAQPFLLPAARAALAHIGVGRIVDAWNKAA